MSWARVITIIAKTLPIWPPPPPHPPIARSPPANKITAEMFWPRTNTRAIPRGVNTNQFSTTNPWGRQSTLQYDNLGRVVAVTDPAAATTKYGYDANGNRTSVIDALGNRTALAYDAKNRLVTSTDALGNITRYQYDSKDH